MKVHDVEQNTDEWYALRAGIPTASEFSNVVNSDGKPSSRLSTYAAQLAAEAFAGKPLERWEGNQWSRRGHELEAEAISAYEFLRDQEAKRVGFVTNKAGAADVGCSPDSLVGKDGLLEVKCLSPKHHVLALAYWHKNDRCPPDYVAQVQGQMLVCEREWVDLWFYHPDLVSHAVRVYRAAGLQAALLRQLGTVVDERDALLAVLRKIGGNGQKTATLKQKAANEAVIVVASVTPLRSAYATLKSFEVAASDGQTYVVREEKLARDLEMAAGFGSPVVVTWAKEGQGRAITGARAK